MRVKLKGLNWTTKRLANGQVVTHYYAWRGGPRLEGEPGSPEFVASYERAYRERRKPNAETFKSIITAYMLSPAFTTLRERTRASYQKIVRKRVIKRSSVRSRTPLETYLSPRLTTHG